VDLAGPMVPCLLLLIVLRSQEKAKVKR